MTEHLNQRPATLPATVIAYRRTDEFTEHTLPAGLRRNHSTKPGVWALIHVLEGQLRYCVPDWQYDVILQAGQTDIVAPQVLHFVEPQSPLRMFVEFHALPKNGAIEPHENPTGV